VKSLYWSLRVLTNTYIFEAITNVSGPYFSGDNDDIDSTE
jgi:hypothetical protein